MSRGLRMSVLGLYHYNDRLFSNLHLPDGFTDANRETVIANILADCAELECLYPDWNTMQFMIGAWSALEMSVWQRIYSASLLEYNPIENYNRTEEETITDNRTEAHTGNDKNTQSGQDTSSGSMTGSETHSGTDTTTNKITAYDSNTLYNHDTQDLAHGMSVADSNTTSGSLNYGKVETFTHGESIKHTGDTTRENHTSGNIGVTTSQQMLQQEVDIAPVLNVAKIIVESFRERFCLLVY